MADYVRPNLARNWDFLVSASGGAYTTVSGVQNLKVSTSKDTADITTFDTEGLNVALPVSFTGELTFEIVESYETSSTPYVQDTGQKILLTADSNLGVESRVYFKIVHKDQTKMTGSFTGTGFVQLDESGGGGNNDVDMMKGKINFDARPVGTGVSADKWGAQ
jgi:predicted secreted protein